MEEYLPIIGLEIHVELATKSKMFCSCKNSYFGHKPNTHCCPVCLGLPGALPVPNKKAIEWCVKLGLALNCQIPFYSKFDRKNYFYPDLPKGYQISQYDKPFAVNGWLEVKCHNLNKQYKKKIRIKRVHMEEDTGKLLHANIDGQKCTLVDYNRSGVPLVEIVTEPDLRSSDEAKIFLRKLYQIIRYLKISEADMEKGSMRLEPNISVMKIQNLNCKAGNKSSLLHIFTDCQLPKYKVEVKNINSFNFAKKAIDYEIKRQIELLSKKETPKQETRGWDEKKGATYTQRSKEEAHDYRYFPEPDIPPIRWEKSQIQNLKSQIGELPDQKLNRFIKEYNLSEYDAAILTETSELADYFENCLKYKKKNIRFNKINSKNIANWIINKKIQINKITPQKLLALISRQTQKTLISDEKIKMIINKVIKNNPKAVRDYKSGKSQVIMFLVGQVMKEAGGKAVPRTVKKLLEASLS